MHNVSPQKNSTRTAQKVTQKPTKEIVTVIKVAFWVPVYAKTLALFCKTFGTTPDLHKAASFMCKGISVTTPSIQKKRGLGSVLKALLFPFSTPRGGANT